MKKTLGELMTTAIVKIILPSLANVNQDPPTITSTLEFFNTDVLPLFKKMNVRSLQNLNTFDLNLPKIQSFLTQVLTTNNITSFDELKNFRDKILPQIPKTLENEIMASFNNLSFGDRAKAIILYPTIVKKEKDINQALPEICAASKTDVKNVKWIVARLLVWATKNYSTTTIPLIEKPNPNPTQPNPTNPTPTENSDQTQPEPTDPTNPTPTEDADIQANSNITKDQVAIKIVDRRSHFFEQNKKGIIVVSSLACVCLGAFAWYKFSNPKQKQKI